MWAEWSEDAQLDWDVLGHPSHLGIQRWVRALNETYRREPALHVLDDTPEGFEWIDVHDASRSVLSYLRWQHDWEDFVAVVANFSATPWPRYELAQRPSRGEVVLKGAVQAHHDFPPGQGRASPRRASRSTLA